MRASARSGRSASARSSPATSPAGTSASAPGGFGGLFFAGIIIGLMYVCLCYCLAEMSPALPHTGGAYSFARSAMGPWGGFVTGLAENIEYVLTPAVIVFFIGVLSRRHFRHARPQFQPVWWVLLLRGVRRSQPARCGAVLQGVGDRHAAGAWRCSRSSGSAPSPQFDFSRWALNIGVDRSGSCGRAAGRRRAVPALRHGRHPCRSCPSRSGCSWRSSSFRSRPRKAHDPKHDMPQGPAARHRDAGVLGDAGDLPQLRHPGHEWPRQCQGAFYLGSSAEPLLDGFRVTLPARRPRFWLCWR